MDMRSEAARQAGKHEPRQTFYPLWGMEYQRPQSNARKFYRNGDRCAWCRYMVKPRGDGILAFGWTIGDTVVSLAAAALFVALAIQVGNALDACMAGLGW